MRILLITLFMLLTAATLFANPPQTIIVEEEPAESDVDHPKKKDDKGHRMPPTPVFCTLDFGSRTVNSTSDKLAGIVEYIGLGSIYGYRTISTQPETSDAIATNLEALADGETASGKKVCYSSIYAKDGCQVRYCPICAFIDGTYNLNMLPSECPQ